VNRSPAHDPIAEFLAHRPVLILDGALATELERHGADLRDPLWSAKLLIERPSLIRAVHLDYFKAGADLATTASYQATFEGFAKRGIDTAGAAQLMRDSVALAVAARDEFWADESMRRNRPRPLVAASVGPFGAMLGDGSEYRGDYALDETALMNFHRPRLQVLAESGADLLACETIPCLREAVALARLLGEIPQATAWISFSCRDGMHTAAGERVADCVARLNEFAQVAGVGVNCTGPQYVVPLLTQMRRHTGKPLLAYPNSGERYDAAGKQWCGGTGGDAPFAAQAQAWVDAGARLIGGCCRTTPADIRALKAWSTAVGTT
jgi:homocysteine S-methyltransferase